MARWRIAVLVVLAGAAGVLLWGAGRRVTEAAPGGGKGNVSEERVSTLDNGAIRVGVNLDLGGAITHVSVSGSDLNLINSHDWGRQIQMSHYSGPVPFAPNGKQPTPHWAGLGWNPIQSGDCFGHRSKTVEHRNEGGELYVKCIPMQWPLENEPGECTFECWIRLEGKTARVRSRMVNQRSDKTQYGARGQELPAVYTNAPFWRLMTYTGDQPFTGGEMVHMPAKMPWSSWRATENWAALVNDQEWGLGIWEPGVFHFIGGFAGKPGAGGPKDAPTGYIAPLHTEVLDHNIVYEYEYTLILGSLKEIRGFVYRQPRPEPPVYRFEKDRQHWHGINASDTGWPIGGEWKVLLEQGDPQLVGPATFWLAKDAPKLLIEGAWHTTGSTVDVFWGRHDAPGFSGDRRASLTVIPDGEFRTYEVDLSASPEYRGAITDLRVAPVPAGKPGEFARIRSISLRKP